MDDELANISPGTDWSGRAKLAKAASCDQAFFDAVMDDKHHKEEHHGLVAFVFGAIAIGAVDRSYGHVKLEVWFLVAACVGLTILAARASDRRRWRRLWDARDRQRAADHAKEPYYRPKYWFVVDERGRVVGRALPDGERDRQHIS
jgi:hypothetical protein